METPIEFVPARALHAPRAERAMTTRSETCETFANFINQIPRTREQLFAKCPIARKFVERAESAMRMSDAETCETVARSAAEKITRALFDARVISDERSGCVRRKLLLTDRAFVRAIILARFFAIPKFLPYIVEMRQSDSIGKTGARYSEFSAYDEIVSSIPC